MDMSHTDAIFTPHSKVNVYDAFSKDFSDMALKMDRYWQSQGIEWLLGVEHEFFFAAQTEEEDIKKYQAELQKDKDYLTKLENKNLPLFQMEISRHHIVKVVM